MSDMKNHLLTKIKDKTMLIGVIGMGYVGLPLSVEKAKAGYKTIGFDTSAERVKMLNEGENYIGDVVEDDLKTLVDNGMIVATGDYSKLSEVDFIAICVPTPLDAYQQPDVSYIKSSAEDIAKYMKPNSIVVLESTTYPGTTRELLCPILEKGSGLKCGEDFYLGFSPERVDPGNEIYKTGNTPKVVGAIGKDATEVIATMYRNVLDGDIFEASTPEIAEMEKILENTYRNINIGLMNELAQLCHRMKIDVWEVVEAAKTKPYGFQAFYPGPGVGGHCIPLDPYYLSWKAREFGFHTSMIETSMTINDGMPEYCVERASHILNRMGKPLNKSNILLLGITYKPNIDDFRESPAVVVYGLLESMGANVSFYDPHSPNFYYRGKTYGSEKSLSAEILEKADLVIITSDHNDIDYALVRDKAKAVFDTKNGMRSRGIFGDNIEVL